MPKILDSEQLQNLRDAGFISKIPVLSAKEAAQIRAHVEGFEKKFPDHVKKLKSRAETLAPWIVEVAEKPRIGDVFEDVWGPNLLLRNMAWRIKKPDGKVFAGWHQDTAAYGNEIEPRHYIGVLAITECSPQSGCLQVVPKSHNWKVLEHTDYDDPTSILARGQQITEEFDRSDVVDLALKPGEMALFNPGIVHGSGVNTSDELRIMVLITLVPTHARPTGGPEPALLVRGVDEYHNFEQTPRPRNECTAVELEAWQNVIKSRARVIFNRSHLAPSEAYGGNRPAV